ncbi:hypothetical protein VFPBJ_07694 [Purpureocillium lilacinum]|uniref:Uncharacterized protein n=1 Tax=Purpureocillium lilacinum TaxID=33203 RepID=A0A179GHB3_PURLI|nr:hypothetical protein VFPBJ_07694 [Purpureocillium lilacinum]
MGVGFQELRGENKGTSQRGCQQLKKGSLAWLRVCVCVLERGGPVAASFG